MATNTDYTRFTYQQLITDFQRRLIQDERFKNLSAASIYQMFMEMLTGTMDMTNFYMARTAEEAFIDTAKLDSSIIKLARNMGYSPLRPTPAEAEIAIEIKGPLPPELRAGSTVYFSQDEVNLTFNNFNYMLTSDYSYTFDADDIENGKSSTWTKRLVFSKDQQTFRYYKLGDVKFYSSADVTPIKCFQGEIKTVSFAGKANLRKLGKNYQYYDVDDLEFSNWYGRRDPNAYHRGKFYTAYGYTKVGMGQTEDDAFRTESLFDIEDCSIYLNEKVIEFEDSDSNDPLHVCAITTNQDKTARVQFGDGVVACNGLNNENQNIFVRYLACKGAEANTFGTTGSKFQFNGNLFATGAGLVVDITNNITFLLNSDITGGTSFEEADSIKRNAPRYFASNDRLVTKSDFEAYFRQMTSPVKVQNAIAWGQDEVEQIYEGGTTTYKYLQNIIMYCIAASTYNINGKVNGVRNVLDEDDDAFGAFTVYGSGTAYLNHLTDYIKSLMSFNSFYKNQMMRNPSKQWLKNIKKIRQHINDKLLVCSKVFSMPPHVQYYDVCGTVTVDSLAKLQDYKLKIENEIYEWLENNTSFCTPIYKADILKFFTNRSETKSVNLDIKVSELIKGTEDILQYNLANKQFNNVYLLNKNIPGAPQYTTYAHKVRYNVITLPKSDANGNQITSKTFYNRNVRVKMYCYNSKDKETKFRNEFQFTPFEVNETSTNVVLSFYGYQERDEYDVIDKNTRFYVYVVGQDDFSTTSNFSEANGEAYNLSSEQIKSVQQDIRDWINGCIVTREANRAIPLPYYIESMDEITRQETIMRVGLATGESEYATQLTEKSFWQYMVPKIISKYYVSSFTDMNDEEIDGKLWTWIDNLVVDIYKQLKATLCDSVLDDNNNIINYSMDNELPVIRLNIKYQYRL